MITMFLITMRRNVLKLWKRKIYICTVLILVLCMAVLTLPIRQICFNWALHKAWRDIPTYDLIRIHYFSNQTHPKIAKALICECCYCCPRSDINYSLFSQYPLLNHDEAKKYVFLKGHGRFLPYTNNERKSVILSRYKTMETILNKNGITFFLLDKSLLGLMRHQGFIPWTDKLYIGLHVKYREGAESMFDCIHDFGVSKHSSFHWAFYFWSYEQYYTLELIFYDNDDIYLWAMTDYLRTTIIYPTNMVFPLADARLEGVNVKIPRDSLALVKRIFNYGICEDYGNYDEKLSKYPDIFIPGYRVRKVDCRELQYMYTMYNLDNG